MLKYPMFQDEIRSLKKDGLLRKISDRSSPQGPRCVIEGRERLNFASNDYLGLAADPRLVQAARDAASKWGAGAGASRLLGGGTEIHSELQQMAAGLKDAPGALLMNSGYAANTGAIPALAGKGDAIFSDEHNHASIIDGCRLSRATHHVYRHMDLAHLQDLLKETSARRKLIVTDSVFSMSGEIARIDSLMDLADRFKAILYLDEAHATGVLGAGGKGTLSHLGLQPNERTVQMGTFSKALGSYGAFVAASNDIIKWLISTARSFVFSTALPPPVVGASIEALNIIRQEHGLLVTPLRENLDHLKTGLRELGMAAAPPAQTPIIPLGMKSVPDALRVALKLLEDSIYAPAIRPPTVPKPIIRIAVTAGHTKEDIDRLLEALKRAMA